MLKIAEYRASLNKSNEVIPRVPSLDEALVHWAMARPRSPFVTEVGTGKSLSYGVALRAVRELQRLFGPKRRTIVLALPGGIAASVVWLAALGGGHRLVMGSPDAMDDEKARLAERYRPDLLIVEQADIARGFGRAGRSTLTRAELDSAIEAWGAPTGSFDDLDVLPWKREGELCLTTSGTTGAPKGVTLQARQIAWTAEQVRVSHRLSSTDRGFTALPFSHINAPVVSLSATLLAGASVAIAPRVSRSRFWDWLKEEHVTWASIVPTIVAVLLQTEKPSWLPGELRFVRTASAPLPAFHLRAFEDRFGVPVVETYGLSEAASQVAANPVPPGRHKPGSVGLPTGVEMRICLPAEAIGAGGPAGESRELRDVAPGTEGEICISGPSVISGYDGGSGAESFVDGWFRTGDMGYQDPDGYVFITGRIRDVINRGGEKISPREVEEVLLTHPDVEDVVVIGEPDPTYGQRAVACVIPRQLGRRDLEPQLRDYSSRRLSRYKVPAAFVLVDALPRTCTGKVQRRLVTSECPSGELAGARRAW